MKLQLIVQDRKNVQFPLLIRQGHFEVVGVSQGIQDPFW